MNPPKSPTPRTDEQVMDWTTEDGSDIVFASMARELETELAAVQAECLEQARLLGISGSREASLIARAEKAETALAIAKQESDLDRTRIASIFWSGVLDTYTGWDVQMWAAEYAKELTRLRARAEKAEARLEFLIVHGGDYVGYAETWNVSIEDLDADMAAAANFNK